MAEFTPNYNLYKPNRADSEAVDVTLSTNFATIDMELKKNEGNIENVKSELDQKTVSLQEQITTNKGDLQEELEYKTTELQEQVNSLVVEGDSSPAIEQALAGTPFTTLRDKLMDTDAQVSKHTQDLQQREINVMFPPVPFNAMKGDETDETSVFQALLNLANTNGSVNLYFPKGIYGMSGHLRLYKNTNIRLHPEAVIKRLGTGYKVFVNGETGNATYATGYNGEGNIHFRGGAIDLNSSGAPIAAGANISAFDLGHGENISFTDLKVTGGQNGHYFQVSSCKNVRFKNCWFGNVYHENTASFNYELIQIEEATDASFPTFGGYDGTISQDIYIDGCIFDGFIRGVGSHSFVADTGGTPLRYCKNITVTNCIFKNGADTALNLMAYEGVTTWNNKVENVNGHGFYMKYVNHSVISTNKQNGVGKSGLHIDNSKSNKFRDNDFLDLCKLGTFSAVRMISSHDNTFSEDTVRSSKHTYAFYASGASTGNRIVTHRYQQGTSGLISGSDATEIQNISILH